MLSGVYREISHELLLNILKYIIRLFYYFDFVSFASLNQYAEWYDSQFSDWLTHSNLQLVALEIVNCLGFNLQTCHLQTRKSQAYILESLQIRSRVNRKWKFLSGLCWSYKSKFELSTQSSIHFFVGNPVLYIYYKFQWQPL